MLDFLLLLLYGYFESGWLYWVLDSYFLCSQLDSVFALDFLSLMSCQKSGLWYSVLGFLSSTILCLGSNWLYWLSDSLSLVNWYCD